jgi:hypothetical protein
MKAYGGVDIQIHIFLISVVAGGDQLQAPTALPKGKEPSMPMGKGARWAPKPSWTMWRREHSWPYRDSNSTPSVVQYVICKLAEIASEQKRLRRCITTHLVINWISIRFPGEILYHRLMYSDVQVWRWTARSRCCQIARTLHWIKIWGHYTTLKKCFLLQSYNYWIHNSLIHSRHNITTVRRVSRSLPSYAVTKCVPLFCTCFFIQKGGETKREQREIKTWVFVIYPTIGIICSCPVWPRPHLATIQLFTHLHQL